MLKNRPSIIKFLSDSTWLIFKKFLKILYNNIIELDKNYKSIYLFINLINIKRIYKSLKLGTF